MDGNGIGNKFINNTDKFSYLGDKTGAGGVVKATSARFNTTNHKSVLLKRIMAQTLFHYPY